nr:hypothetical protein [Tanacetum cinerariifolium]
MVVGFGLCGLFLHGVIMNRGFMDPKGRKNNHRKKTDTTTGIGFVTESDGTLNDVTPLVDFVEKKVESPSVIDENVAKEKQSPLVNTTGLGSFPPLPTPKTPSDGTAPGKSLYANVTSKPIGKKLNFHTWFTPGGNGIDVVIPVESIEAITFSEDELSAIATKLGTGEMKNLKKTRQTSKCFPVGQKMGFQPTKQVYQPVSKKLIANTSVNKKKNVDPTKENMDASSPSTTLVIKKIDKIEKLIIDGKVTLVDDDGKPLEKVVSSCDYDSKDEVASFDNDMVKFLAKNDGYGTQSLLEQ